MCPRIRCYAFRSSIWLCRWQLSNCALMPFVSFNIIENNSAASTRAHTRGMFNNITILLQHRLRVRHFSRRTIRDPVLCSKWGTQKQGKREKKIEFTYVDCALYMVNCVPVAWIHLVHVFVMWLPFEARRFFLYFASPELKSEWRNGMKGCFFSIRQTKMENATLDFNAFACFANRQVPTTSPFPVLPSIRNHRHPKRVSLLQINWLTRSQESSLWIQSSHTWCR